MTNRYSLADFAAFCRHLKTESGRPFTLKGFQRRLLQPYFGGTQQTVIMLPTGNGKTTLLAALALYHMLRVPNANVLFVASAADQAGTLFRQARTLILESRYADLLDVQTGTYRIYHKGTPRQRRPGEIRVIASEVGQQEGAIPTLVVLDELHAHRDMAMYEMLRDKLWKRAEEPGCGRMVAISTAGFSFDSPLFKLQEKIKDLPSYKRVGPYVSAEDPEFCWREYSLEPDQDRNDLGLVAKANPAPWITKKVLARRKTGESTTLSPGEWARSACNVWTAGAEQPIKPEEWDRLKVDIGRLESGERVILVPSVGHNAAIALVASRPEGRVICKVEVLEHEDGSSILARTEARILELCRDYNAEIHAPGVGFLRSRELLLEKRLRVEDAPQSTPGLAAATGTFNRMLRAGLLMHDGDPVLRAHALSATMKTNEAGERYEVTDRARGLIALVMAVHGVTAMHEPKPKIHAYQGA